MGNKNLNLEDQEQIALFDWARLEPMIGQNGVNLGAISDYMFAVPNGARLTIGQARKMVRMGLKKGVSDVLLAYPASGRSGLWVEMKKQRQHFRGKVAATKAVSAEQMEWLDRMSRSGFACAVAYGWADAKEIIEEYLRGDYRGWQSHTGQ